MRMIGNVLAFRNHASRCVDDTGKKQLGDDFDNPRAANARYTGSCDSFPESRIIRPQLAADHLEPRPQGFSIDSHALDCTRRRPLTATDLRAFECRSRWTRARYQAILASENQLGVGANVDHQG